MPVLTVQQIPYDSPESKNFFRPGPDKPFVATPAAIAAYQAETIHHCLSVLQNMADRFDGLDFVQVFEDPDEPEALWFIEDGPGGVITALLPSEY